MLKEFTSNETHSKTGSKGKHAFGALAVSRGETLDGEEASWRRRHTRQAWKDIEGLG